MSETKHETKEKESQMNLLIVAALTLKLDLGTLFHRTAEPVRQPSVTCGIKTVSYRFVGAPGTQFRYDGETFTVPASGDIELIAGKRATEYQIAGRTLPLEVWPKDEFGMRTVPLPTEEGR
ncbi:MAG TPA: hypothetical protein VMU84_15830 [Thermoanaerobaculia bacterium]|nr:hypothetical protein [Thermoanaerobaculia bacterium]